MLAMLAMLAWQRAKKRARPLLIGLSARDLPRRERIDGCASVGADERQRSPNLRITSALLCQLSYVGIAEVYQIEMVQLCECPAGGCDAPGLATGGLGHAAIALYLDPSLLERTGCLMPMATREAQREYGRQWIAKRRADWLTEHGPCYRCGTWERLEVDHIDRTQKVHHAVWSWSQKRRDAELAKCQVLCHDCHRAKTLSSGDHLPRVPRAQNTPFQHGTLHGYTKWQCRCAACTEAKRTSHKLYRDRRQSDPERRVKWPPNKKTVPRICQTCSSQFMASPGEVKRGRAKFCDKMCYLARLK